MTYDPNKTIILGKNPKGSVVIPTKAPIKIKESAQKRRITVSYGKKQGTIETVEYVRKQDKKSL